MFTAPSITPDTSVDCSMASGARRSCAGAAVANALNAADIIAVIVALGDAHEVAEGLTAALGREADTQVLSASGELSAIHSGWLDKGEARRAVLLWEPTLSQLGSAETVAAPLLDLVPVLGSGTTGPSRRRAVVVAPVRLMDHIPALLGMLPHTVRFRYVLVR